ncbi:MAG TPA: nitroreductase/quinone reductase family protein [Solirubrobacteraceae bacterium]|nr:nitroreductase/quinone reductase family protein [Solirubrobacteraceae bacterium]
MPAITISRAPDLKRRLSKLMTTRLVNPVVRRVVERGVLGRGWSVLETTGRRSGRPRRVPLGNGLRGDAFWIVTEHGHAADYVRNIQADPRVRVNVHGRWRTGTARVLEDDDPRERLRRLGRPVNDALLLAAGSQLLTVRVDLD